MKRRHFIQSTLSSGLALSLMPYSIFSQNNEILYDALIGKGNPELFGHDYLLQKSANEAYIAMKNEAEKSGIKIHIVSSYRSFDHQKQIWTRKYRKNIADGLTPQKSINKIIEYSTIPGTSRHHWGTEIDIVDGNFINTPNLLSENNFKKGFPFFKLKTWLQDHANTFNYHIVYTNDPNRSGFKYEPWHYSYKPLSIEYLKQYRDLNLVQILKNEKIEGSEYFSNDFFQTYYKENILDINPELLP